MKYSKYDVINTADDYGLADFKYEGDKVIYLHTQDIDPVLEQVHKERMGNDSNGFTDGRTMRKIGSISHIEFLRNPILKEAMDSGDPELIAKACEIYLKTDEGKKYATVTKGI